MKSKELRKEEEAERLAFWRGLSPSQQLADLDRRLGKGIGARRQRKLIGAKLYENMTQPKFVVKKGTK